jgi:hypothetical protein
MVVLAGCGGSSQAQHASSATSRTLVDSRSPNGVPFSIEGRLHTSGTNRLFCFSSGTLAGPPDQRYQETSSPFCPGMQPGSFAIGAFIPCKPHPFQLIYGLLRVRAATVEIYLDRRLLAVKRITIPNLLDAGGQLLYGITTSENIVTVRVQAPGRAPRRYQIGSSGSVRRNCSSGATITGEPIEPEG